MCQLAAYIGDRPIAPLLLEALRLQEPYLAGLATGMATIHEGKLAVEKATGHIGRVKRTTHIARLRGTTGIAHSRYSILARDDPRFDIDAMAHPFTNDDETIALMHNGAISNFKDHWVQLRESHRFKSYNPDIDWITDSEIAVHLISDRVRSGKSLEVAIRDVFPQLQGAVLLCLISVSEPETIYLANRYQPCYIGLGKNEAMWCSSRIGFQPIKDALKKIYQPPKNSLIRLTRKGVELQTLDPDWNVPKLTLKMKTLKQAILRIVSAGEIDFRNLWNAMNYGGGWGQAYGISCEEMAQLRKIGVSIVNPLIDALDDLVEAGELKRRLDRRLEGSTPDTPRFVFWIP